MLTAGLGVTRPIFCSAMTTGKPDGTCPDKRVEQPQNPEEGASMEPRENELTRLDIALPFAEADQQLSTDATRITGCNSYPDYEADKV